MKTVIGDITVQTTYVSFQRCYLTTATQGEGGPFDIKIANNETDAMKNHNLFIDTAELTMKVVPLMEEAQAKGIVPDIDALIMAHAPIPPGTLLN